MNGRRIGAIAPILKRADRLFHSISIDSPRHFDCRFTIRVISPRLFVFRSPRNPINKRHPGTQTVINLILFTWPRVYVSAYIDLCVRCCTLALETDNVVQVLCARTWPIISRAESDIIFNRERTSPLPLPRTVAAVLECFVPEQWVCCSLLIASVTEYPGFARFI